VDINIVADFVINEETYLTEDSIMTDDIVSSEEGLR